VLNSANLRPLSPAVGGTCCETAETPFLPPRVQVLREVRVKLCSSPVTSFLLRASASPGSGVRAKCVSANLRPLLVCERGSGTCESMFKPRTLRAPVTCAETLVAAASFLCASESRLGVRAKYVSANLWPLL